MGCREFRLHMGVVDETFIRSVFSSPFDTLWKRRRCGAVAGQRPQPRARLLPAESAGTLQVPAIRKHSDYGPTILQYKHIFRQETNV